MSKNKICKNVFSLARKPTAKQIAEAARARAFQRHVNTVTKESMEIVSKHAEAYFDAHPKVDKLLYETFISNGEVKMSSREYDDPKPEGIVIASCLKYRYHRGKHTIPERACIGSKWVFNMNVDTDKFRKLPETTMTE